MKLLRLIVLAASFAILPCLRSTHAQVFKHIPMCTIASGSKQVHTEGGSCGTDTNGLMVMLMDAAWKGDCGQACGGSAGGGGVPSLCVYSSDSSCLQPATSQPAFNVRDFGAKGDAVAASNCESDEDVPIGCATAGTGTDDADAINAAINAACAAGLNASVYIPGGDYRVGAGASGLDGIIIPCSGVTLYGDKGSTRLYAGGKGYLIAICENIAGGMCSDPDPLYDVTVRDLKLADDDPFMHGLGSSMYYNITGLSGTFVFLEQVTCTGGGPGYFYWKSSDDSRLVIQSISTTCTGTVTGTKSGASATISSAIDDTLSEESHGILADTNINPEFTGLTFEALGDEGLDLDDCINPNVHDNIGWQSPSTPSSGSVIAIGHGTRNAKVHDNIIEMGLSGGMTGGNKCISIEAVGCTDLHDTPSCPTTEQISGSPDSYCDSTCLPVTDYGVYQADISGNTCTDDDDGNFDHLDAEIGISVGSNTAPVIKPSINHNTIVDDTHEAGECSFTVTTTVGSLGSCGAGNNGEYKKVTDGADANDCSTGSGSDIHWCECVNPTWTARTETKNCDEHSDCYGSELCTGLMAACQGVTRSCQAIEISEGTYAVTDPHVEGNNITGRVEVRSSAANSSVAFLDNQMTGTARTGLVAEGENITIANNGIHGFTNSAIWIDAVKAVISANIMTDIGGGKAGSTGVALISLGSVPDVLIYTGNYLEADPTIYEEDYVNNGLSCDASEGSVVSDNLFVGIHEDAIRSCKKVVGNRCEDVGANCVEQPSLDHTTILGNTSVNSGSIDFYIGAGSDGNVVSGNTCEDSANTCVHVEGSGGGAYTTCVGNVSINSGAIKCGNVAAENCDASEADATSLCGMSIDY